MIVKPLIAFLNMFIHKKTNQKNSKRHQAVAVATAFFVLITKSVPVSLFAAEGLSMLVVPPIGYGENASMRDERTLYVPTGKAHVAREILRKI